MATEQTIVALLRTLRTQGKTIIVVHHDLQTLQDYFDWLLLLNIKLIACGPINQVLHAENLHATYGKHTLFTTCFERKPLRGNRENKINIILYRSKNFISVHPDRSKPEQMRR